ncbi:D-2-hydroxyglutarate dehydrogenase, mitochondrial-like [Mizuhopecten yessoensis]|uniref:D-2-hydroxyglutarate dehydrogenase, mitochondrial n=1 Tax=Mizuhopecten yessoensis TaxID=6573 RepID=A0A210R5A8_MIZYE|nr:D-2-hydroxyglutarate dehydrogenase, mitochondrial-like [Mizuhopecten yessoensis]OWF56209.1 D-2-hydroxyglutarate dehydrogenase, mitochondrial [Mizuhopecten yessoensis]
MKIHNVFPRLCCFLTKSQTRNTYNSCRAFHSTGRSQSVVLTKTRYPNLKRGPFSTLGDVDVQFFERLLPGTGRVLADASEIEGYNTDWLRTCRGCSELVLRPKTTEEVSAILNYCNTHNLAVVPQGGNTGLVGGSVPVFDEVVVSTQLLNQIISLDELSGSLVCQSGCVLGTLEDYIADYNLTIPLDLGAKGSCHIGGNIATNAGGVRLLRYGSLHGSILGLEAVLPNGEILDCMSTLRKDNTGYDLKQLFIGSEGTLGIVTAASVLCPQKPSAVSVAFLGCESFSKVLDIYKQAKGMLAEILSAYEFLDEASVAVNKENLKMTSPIGDFPFFVLIETSGSNGDHDEEKLNTFLEAMMSDGLVLDGTVVTESTKIKDIWSLRERVAEGLLHDGYCYKYDVSLPQAKFYDLVLDMRERLGSSVIRVVGYGHVGDGNLHLNMTSPTYSSEVMGNIEPFVYDWVSKYSGSISAEHGLGFKKRNFIYHSKSKSAVSLMQQIKKSIDPNGIMNPYKVLPEE